MNEVKSTGIYKTRLAIKIGFIAPFTEFLNYLFSDFGHIFYEVFVVAGIFLLGMFLLVGWFLLYPTIILISDIVRYLFDKSGSANKWHFATDKALWTLPWVAAFGVTLWLLHSFGHFGGWPADVIFGTIANIIGAWCYLTIFRSWYLLVKQKKQMVSQHRISLVTPSKFKMD